jgi:hypothetical protein
MAIIDPFSGNCSGHYGHLHGFSETLIYNPSFNTVLSQDLLLALLRGELSAPPDVTAWLDLRRSIGKSSY